MFVSPKKHLSSLASHLVICFSMCIVDGWNKSLKQLRAYFNVTVITSKVKQSVLHKQYEFVKHTGIRKRNDSVAGQAVSEKSMPGSSNNWRRPNYGSAIFPIPLKCGIIMKRGWGHNKRSRRLAFWSASAFSVPPTNIANFYTLHRKRSSNATSSISRRNCWCSTSCSKATQGTESARAKQLSVKWDFSISVELRTFYRAMHVVLARYCYRKSSVRPSVCL